MLAFVPFFQHDMIVAEMVERHELLTRRCNNLQSELNKVEVEIEQARSEAAAAIFAKRAAEAARDEAAKLLASQKKDLEDMTKPIPLK